MTVEGHNLNLLEMSSMQEGSSLVSRKMNKTTGARRSWTHQEEAILIASLRELIGQGWKSDNGFRAGYLNKLEEAMKTHFPNTDLKGAPHINSKLTTWKRNYYSLTVILSRSGVGFNMRGNHMIDCEDDTWEQIIKIDPNARSMRFKMWPHYDDWKEIYGRDRATGETSENVSDAWNGISEEAGMEESDFSAEDLLEHEGASESVSNARKGPMQVTENSTKKRKATDEASSLCKVIEEFGKKTEARLSAMADSIGYEAALEDAFEQLGKIEGLSIDQRFDVCEILSANVDKVNIFKGLPDSARAQYVERLLRNKGK